MRTTKYIYRNQHNRYLGDRKLQLVVALLGCLNDLKISLCHWIWIKISRKSLNACVINSVQNRVQNSVQNSKHLIMQSGQKVGFICFLIINVYFYYCFFNQRIL